MKSLIPNVTFYSHDDELEKMTQDMGHIKRKLLAGEESITADAYARDSKLKSKKENLTQLFASSSYPRSSLSGNTKDS